MEKRCRPAVWTVSGLFLAGIVQAVTPQPEEFRLRDEWLGRTSLAGSTLGTAPFSFVYDGKLFAVGANNHSPLQNRQTRHDSQKLDAQRTQRTLIYTDPATGLQVRCVVVEYHDFPTVEWTLYFTNTSSADTPIIEKIQALDIKLDYWWMDAGDGMVQIFRRPNSFYDSAHLKLLGLDVEASYLVTNVDTGAQQQHSGRELLSDGLAVTTSARPDVVVLIYRRQS